jgi:hypothetical protein
MVAGGSVVECYEEENNDGAGEMEGSSVDDVDLLEEESDPDTGIESGME